MPVFVQIVCNAHVRTGLTVRSSDRRTACQKAVCDRPTRPRFPVVSLSLRANAEPVPQIHVFPWFPSVLEQMLSQYPKSTWQWMLFMQPSPKLSSQFSAKLHAPNTIKTSSFCCPPNKKSAQTLHSSAAYCQQSTSQRFSLLPACLYQKDGRALPGCFGAVNVSAFPTVRRVALLTAPPLPHAMNSTNPAMP